MPNEVLRKGGDCILFAKSTVAPTAANVLAASYTRYDLDLSATVANGGARQSAKADLGARRAPAYNVYACIEFATAPTSGSAISFYWAPSLTATAGTGNVAYCTGVEGSWAGYPTSGSVAEDAAKLQFIGQMSVCDLANAVQIGFVGTFSPASRYGQLIVRNDCGQTLFTTDAYEHQVLFEPVIDEVQ